MPRIALRPDQPFSLDQTLGCGQVFRWDRAADGWWCGVTGNRVIRCRQEGMTLMYEGADEASIRHYFSLDLDLGAILEAIDRDPFIHEAIEQCRGLRLVRPLRRLPGRLHGRQVLHRTAARRARPGVRARTR